MTVVHPARRFIALAGTALAVFLLAELLLDLTAWGQAWDDRALLAARLLPEAVWDTCDTILRIIRIPSIIAVAIACLVIAAARRQLLTGIVAVAGIGAAIVSAEAIKFLTPRPDLAPEYTLMVDNEGANTFPSGHATLATALGMGVIIVVAPGWRTWTASAVAVLTCLFACSTVIAGWHRPSDAIGGIAFATVWMALAGLVLTRMHSATAEPGPSRGYLIASAALGGLALAAVAALATALPGSSALAFASAEALIAIVALAAVVGFTLCLRDIDLSAHRR